MSETKIKKESAITTRQKVRRAIILVSFLLFPITMNYFSPYLIIDGASHGIINGSFIVFVLLFFFSLFLGRSFCGWVCPGAGLQEACFAVSDKKARGGKHNWIKYFIWVPWLSLIIVMAILADGLHTINPLHMMETGISVAEPANYFVYFTIVGLFVIVSFTTGKRGLCHYLCWMAPFMVVGTKIKNFFRWPSLNLNAKPAECKSCHTCDKNCPMSLEVSKMVESGSMDNSECILCGTCVDNCPNGAINYTWKRKKVQTAQS